MIPLPKDGLPAAGVIAGILLSGGTSDGLKLLLFGGMGVALLSWPAVREHARPVTIASVLLFLLALVHLLPATWLPVASSQHLPESLRQLTSSTLAWQAWPARQGILQLAGAWMFFILTASLPGGRINRQQALRYLAAALGILSVLILSLGVADLTPPGWPEQARLGPFSNENQTVSLLVATFWLTLLTGLSPNESSPWRRSLWIAAALTALTGAGLTAGRSALLLLALGGIAISLYLAWRRSRHLFPVIITASGIAIMALGVASLIEMPLAGTWRQDEAVTSRILEDADQRMAIWQDAMTMTAELAPFGVGLGNFADTFGLWRELADNNSHRIIHPESSWLWGAVELGILAPLLVALILTRIIWHGLREPSLEDPALKVGAWLALFSLIIHSLWDVGGYRLGTAWLGLALLALLAPARGKPLPTLPIRLGSLAVVIAAITFASGHWPHAHSAEQAKENTRQALQEGNNIKARTTVATALRYRPLDSKARHMAGLANLALGDTSAANHYFEQVAALDTTLTPYLFNQTRHLLRVGQTADALSQWRHAMERIPPDQRAPHLHAWLRKTRQLYRFQQGILLWMHETGLSPLPYATNLHPQWFRTLIRQTNQTQLEKLPPETLQTLYLAWVRSGFQPSRRETIVETSPRLKQILWQERARTAARNKHYQEAVTLVLDHGQSPNPIGISQDRPPETWKKTFQQNPGDKFAGLAALETQWLAQDWPAASQTIQHLRDLHPDDQLPAWLHYVAFRTQANADRPRQAWREWNLWLKKAPPK